MRLYYFDNVVRNKPKHRIYDLGLACSLFARGDVYYISLRETQNPNEYKLYVFDDDGKYSFETPCSYGDYCHILKMYPTIYRWKEFLAF